MKKIMMTIAAILTVTACGNNEKFDATGTFEAVETTVSSEAAGRLLSFDVEEGDSLREGQQIGIVDTVQLNLQRLQLLRQSASVKSSRPDINKQVSALREQIAKCETERSRIENLLKDGAATSKQLDDVNAQIKVLKGQLAAQMSALQNSTASIDENSSAIDLQVAQVEDRLSKCHIVTPVSGTVLAKYVEEGELVGVGSPLVRVADLDKIYLRAYFSSDQLSGIKLGQKVKVIADFGAEEQYEYPGTVTWISGDSEFTPKTIQTRNTRANLVYAVKISVKNDGKLKIGLYGEVVL